jgi:hypothetical protein
MHIPSRTGWVRSAHGVGTLASLACTVHCLALPVLAAALPAFRGHSNLWIERGVSGVVLAIGAVAAISVYQRTRNRPLLALFVGALTLVAAGLLLPASGDRLIIAGSLALAAGHLVGLRSHRHAHPLA